MHKEHRGFSKRQSLPIRLSRREKRMRLPVQILKDKIRYLEAELRLSKLRHPYYGDTPILLALISSARAELSQLLNS
jgi:hypothetical protein